MTGSLIRPSLSRRGIAAWIGISIPPRECAASCRFETGGLASYVVFGNAICRKSGGIFSSWTTTAPVGLAGTTGLPWVSSLHCSQMLMPFTKQQGRSSKQTSQTASSFSVMETIGLTFPRLQRCRPKSTSMRNFILRLSSSTCLCSENWSFDPR